MGPAGMPATTTDTENDMTAFNTAIEALIIESANEVMSRTVNGEPLKIIAGYNDIESLRRRQRENAKQYGSIIAQFNRTALFGDGVGPDAEITLDDVREWALRILALVDCSHVDARTRQCAIGHACYLASHNIAQDAYARVCDAALAA